MIRLIRTSDRLRKKSNTVSYMYSKDHRFFHTEWCGGGVGGNDLVSHMDDHWPEMIFVA